jgi:hypothetical protein
MLAVGDPFKFRFSVLVPKILDLVLHLLTQIFVFVFQVLMFFLFTNSSVNFYIYCLGCRKFRKDLVKMISGALCRGGTDTNNGSTASTTTDMSKI